MKHEFDLVAFIRVYYAWAIETFGPGPRTTGICKHIEKELDEIRAEPGNLDEWVDVIQLAIVGAAREGFTPEQICAGIEAKLHRNQGRTWPDWRKMPLDGPIEHIRGQDAAS